MATEKRLIDGNGRYTLHASDNTDYSLLFKNGIICVENELGHCVCEFYADDAPTVDAVEVVHGHMEEIEPCQITVDRQCCLCGTPMGKCDNYCPSCGAKMDGGNEK